MLIAHDLMLIITHHLVANIYNCLLQTPYYWPSNIFDPENTDYGKLQVVINNMVTVSVIIMSSNTILMFKEKYNFIKL